MTRLAHDASQLARFWDSILIFALSFALYIVTLAPDLLPADSGEFQVVVPLLGVAHPPGFALYTLLGRLFVTLVPLGSPAYRLNLFSALTGALTLVLVGGAAKRLGGSRRPGLAAALALGVSTTFWSQSTTANIRSLAAMLTALAVYAFAGYRRAPSAKRLAFLAFSISLAVVHHLSVAFIGAALALGAAWFVTPALRAELLQWRNGRAAKILIAAAAPLAVLIYLPVRGAQAAFLAPPGLDTLPGFLQHVLAAGFGGDIFYFANPAALPDRMPILLNIFVFQFGPPLTILFALGLPLFFWRDPKLALVLASAFLIHGFVAITYRAPQTVEYLLPAYVILVVAGAAGLASAAAQLAAAIRPSSVLNRFSWVIRRLSYLVLASLLTASSLLFFRNYPSYAALAGDTSVRDYAAAALKAAPPGAVILSSWHFATPLWYLQQIENVRRDVEVEYVFPQGPSLARNWVDRLDANVPARPTLITNFYPLEYAGTSYRFIPAGPLRRVVVDPPTELPAHFQPVNAPHAQGWTVLAAQLSANTISPAGSLVADVAWQAPEAPVDTGFFVQLIGPDGALYGQMDVSHPASRLAPGEIVIDRFQITANVDTQPGEYKLVAGAYLPDGTRLAPDFTELAAVTVLPRAAPPATRHPQPFGLVAGYDFDLSIPDSPRLYIHWRLDGQPHALALTAAGGAAGRFDLPAASGYITTAHDIQPGEWPLTLADSASPLAFTFPPPRADDRYVSFGPVVLTRVEATRERDGSYRLDLDWLADKPLTDDLIFKIDLIGANYSWRVQSDSVPAGGAIPTLKWIPGIVIQDRRRLTPAAAGPATFELAVYDHFTQKTLPILDSRLARLGPTVPLGRVQP